MEKELTKKEKQRILDLLANYSKTFSSLAQYDKKELSSPGKDKREICITNFDPKEKDKLIKITRNLIE